ncbi:TraB/GumN family protein [Pseudaminobacter sp. 19-2017]|uniref:TraB/GumN family protein n=1 Tax=Pseudaminobacter soli (ex Zhang et al. 2022) TaxID=2831468 RepID=A0A942DVC0_9HYPH|nr:TraB/GumN family protein [Pseudaminobacter soli]MBS3647934.1 TraB/GumN family protein [Pseudaminobacter soli]
MKRVVAIAERGAAPLLHLLAALRLLFFLAFLFSLVFAASQVRAETIACAGKDLISGLQHDDPALYEEIKSAAAKTENGSGILWKIEKQGVGPSYLFGTMHVTDPRVTSLPPDAKSAFDQSKTVVIETTDVLDQAKMMAALAKTPELMMFTDDTTLTSLLPPDEAEIVNKALDARGIPHLSVAKMKPWIIAAMVALPACELQRKAAGAPVLDVKLAQDGQASGKVLMGLETVADQLGAMASLPMDFHLKGLVETLKLGDRMEDVVETMVVLYLRGDTGMIWPLLRGALPAGADDEAGYAAFEEAMLTARNKTMVERARPILDEGNAFIAVGALHLPGSDGIVSLLRKDGYTVSPVAH